MNRGPVPGEVVTLSPRVRRLTQDNPGIFTGWGTNTHLIGNEALFILDPGADDDGHFRRLVEVVGGTQVLAIIPTHSHPDHWPLAPRLAQHFGAPVLGFEARAGFEPEKTVVDGEVLKGPDTTLEALHTPGHARDHLTYLLHEERALLSGDHVMGWSTSVISPPDGNLGQYVASLERLRDREVEVMYPAHGLPITDPGARIQELVTHRHERTRQILDALSQGLARVPEMVLQIYADIDPRLHPAAGQSLLAHLEALVEEGRVVVVEAGKERSEVAYELVARP